MRYDFEQIIDRKNTNSLKYDFAAERGRPSDILPLWVADMDFQLPDEIINVLIKRVKHGIFGYSESREDYYTALENWFSNHFDWKIENEWLVKTPGVVFALAMAIRAFTNEGDAVLIQNPVYYPFTEVILANRRRLIDNSLVYQDGKYHINFDEFEAQIVKNNVKLFILCSPHNPVGRVWTTEELNRMGDICIKHHVLVVSDEIHADFTYKGYVHHIFGSIKPEFLHNSIICTAPSKTFNLAGLQVSNIFIADKEIRERFTSEIDKTGYSQLNTMGLAACQAAYEYGADWLGELKEYLEGNLNFVRNFIREHLPKIKLVEPEGTYLLWLDFSQLGLSEEESKQIIIHKAKLWLDHGTIFGREGKGFERINIACPRSVLEKALKQLEAALDR